MALKQMLAEAIRLDHMFCYQLVKDLRNKIENTNPSSVLDGNIDQFIEEGIKIKK